MSEQRSIYELIENPISLALVIACPILLCCIATQLFYIRKQHKRYRKLKEEWRAYSRFKQIDEGRKKARNASEPVRTALKCNLASSQEVDDQSDGYHKDQEVHGHDARTVQGTTDNDSNYNYTYSVGEYDNQHFDARETQQPYAAEYNSGEQIESYNNHERGLWESTSGETALNTAHLESSPLHTAKTARVVPNTYDGIVYPTLPHISSEPTNKLPPIPNKLPPIQRSKFFAKKPLKPPF